MMFVFCLILFFCSNVFADVEMDYDYALQDFNSGKYKASLMQLHKLQIDYPFSATAMLAELKMSEIYYILGRYGDAIVSAENYIKFYPIADNVDHAHYIKAISNYHNILPVTLDQDFTVGILGELEEFCDNFPDSEYLQDVKSHIAKARNTLSAKEFYIANSYIKRKKYVSALIRLLNIVENYNDTEYYYDAVMNVAKIYSFFGLSEEADYTLVGNNTSD